VRRRLAAVLLLAASAWLWFGVAAPARRARDAARDEFARLRAERERLRTQVEAASRRAAVVITPEKGASAARALRRALLRAAEAASVSDVAIAASPARGRFAAAGRLSAEGSLESLLAVADRLTDPATGVALRKFVLTAAEPDKLRLEAEAVSLRAGP
jgi:hypothetical protein